MPFSNGIISKTHNTKRGKMKTTNYKVKLIGESPLLLHKDSVSGTGSFL